MGLTTAGLDSAVEFIVVSSSVRLHSTANLSTKASSMKTLRTATETLEEGEELLMHYITRIKKRKSGEMIANCAIGFPVIWEEEGTQESKV